MARQKKTKWKDERKKYEADAAVMAEAQALTEIDSQYLYRYLLIAEDFCGLGFMGEGGKITYGEAKRRLDDLNEEFAGRIKPCVIRTRFPAEGHALGGYRRTEVTDARCWMPSDLCYGPNVDGNVNYRG